MYKHTVRHDAKSLDVAAAVTYIYLRDLNDQNKRYRLVKVNIYCIRKLMYGTHLFSG